MQEAAMKELEKRLAQLRAEAAEANSGGAPCHPHPC